MPNLAITVTPAQAIRIQTALGLHLGLTTPIVVNPDGTTEGGVNRPATAAEIREWLVGHIRNIVEAQELAAICATVTVPDLGEVS